ncbi:MAG: hypothetical protein AAB472_02555 [Patescibacteria group bacterium]
MVVRIIATVGAFLSVLLFPWQLALFIVAGVSALLPPVALVVGVFTDALYWSQGPLPYATLCGLAITLIAFVVERFVRTRIMAT